MKKYTLTIACIFLLAVLWPLPSSLTHPISLAPTQILDRSGHILYELRHPNYGSQQNVSFSNIPDHLITSLIATEDRTFLSHHGISPKSIARAAYQNYQSGRIVSGGSTITQQLVRIRFQPKSRGYLYKLLEAYLALKLEMSLTKEEILEAYLNSVYFGEQAYGIVSASKTYFSKSISELSSAEGAFLIGLIQSPTDFNPFKQFEKARERQKTVIRSLVDSNAITTAKAEEMKLEKITLTVNHIDIHAPHFVFWLIDQLGDQVHDQPQVTTTLDLSLQSEIELIIAHQLEKLEDKNVTAVAVIVLDATNGQLLSMVGSADYFDDEHDGAVNVAVSPRQPGSALKPFTYALALQNGQTAATTIADIETRFFTQEGNPYIPRNYDYGYHGLVRYREALANSYNISAVKTLEQVGVDNLLNFLKDVGITTLTESPEHYGLALTLGAGEVNLLELTKAYSIFARQGQPLSLKYTLMEGEDDDPRLSGFNLSEGKNNDLNIDNVSRLSPLQGEKVASGDQRGSLLDPRIAYLITNILSDNEARIPEFGEDSPLNFDFPVAAKTGTTRNSRDNWVIGYTPSVIVGVWVGNADNSPMRGTSGVTGAGPIFHSVMLTAMRGRPRIDFQRPPGIISKEICHLSGKLPTPTCPRVMSELFISGTEPKEQDDLYRQVSIDTRNNLLASASCPQQYIVHKTFAVFPLELQKWARENGWPEHPQKFSPLCNPDQTPTSKNTRDRQPETIDQITITSPQSGDSFNLDPIIPDENEKIIFEASANSSIDIVTWYVDEAPIGQGKSPDFRSEWMPIPGRHTIRAESNTGHKNEITIEVIGVQKSESEE